MQKISVDRAANEARRFLDKYAEWLQTYSVETYMEGTPHECHVASSSPPLHAALRRASLDLTRALANMRKG